MADRDPNEVLKHETGQTREEVAENWRAQEPIIAAQDEAVRALAPALVGKTVGVARVLVEHASSTAGAELSIRFVEDADYVTDDYVYGRITARVRGGAVDSAEMG
jgi:hypothetical protein